MKKERYNWADIKQMIANGKAEPKSCRESMKGKVCVISGATSGVGLAGVRRLAEFGADIVMICRNPEKAEAVCSEIRTKFRTNIRYYIADFQDLDSVRKSAEKLLAETPVIHVLINSAGLHSTTRILTGQGVEAVFCVNHLAVFLLTCLLLDRIRKSAPARIIQVNSQGHRFGGLRLDDINWKKRIYNDLRSYGASKTAQLYAVRTLAVRLAGTGVTINAMHPGAVRTNLGGNNGPLYRWFLHTVLWPTMKDPEISGAALHYLAAAPELSGMSGRFFNLTTDEKPSPHIFDRKKQDETWDLTLEMTGLTGKIP